jgi:hypothetical protein
MAASHRFLAISDRSLEFISPASDTPFYRQRHVDLIQARPEEVHLVVLCLAWFHETAWY